ncbi:Deaminated glutathione amidase [Alphaproteobacteria bacterium SO-S41]|nr:Deaminated glutathione amidase [Alphaproteobacteria bacterium SO-S41]
MTKFRAACVQMRSSDDMAANIADASALIRDAAGQGAHYIQTPENTCLMAPDGGAKFDLTFDEANDPALPAFRALAEELGVWLHIGSLAIKVGPDKVANRAFVIDPQGAIAAHYDKIHLFDVQLANGEDYKESATVAPGDKLSTVELPWGKLGVSICYDLRFPHLYRSFGKAGCSFIAIPAAFTKTTGEAHWHVLQRARAIENGAFVISAAQGGRHANGRQTYGHSLIIDPWGEILAEGGTEPGVVIADIDPAEVAAVRGRIPALSHDRPYS